MLNKLAANRNLLKNLVVRDLKRRYIGSIGGFFWSVVHPLVMLASYTFMAQIIFKQKLGPEYGLTSFPVFMFCGILPWLMFSDTIMRSCSSITDNAPLITKTVMPAEILPMSILISNLVQHAIGMAILLGVLVTFSQVHASVLFLLIYVPMLLLLAQGIGWLVAGLQVFVRDTVQALQVVLIFWFWITPVAYAMDLSIDGTGSGRHIPSALRIVALMNPMVTIVTGYRNSLLNLAQPSTSTVLGVFTLCAAIFAIGGYVFRQAKPAFPDVL